jgi:fucose 4-O-acetylase-like acetyltransferase
MSLDELVAKTPETRDRYVDFLRAVSIVAVVFGHWFIGIIWWRHGIIRDTSAIGVTSWLWLATWFFQVMPIFFFVGGFSNMVTFESYERRGETTWAFIKSRLVRLLKPSLLFLGVWVIAQVALHLADVGAPAGVRLLDDTRMLRGVLPPAATIPFGPLWFLAVYLIIVCIAPVTIRLHRRFGLWVPAIMALAAIVIDVVAFGFDHPALRYLNIAPILLLPHQLGHFYADGSLLRQPRRVFVAMAATGLGGLILLTNEWIFLPFSERFRWFPGIGHYPKSLLGTDVERLSNAYPPTICFMLGGIWAIGVVMLLRPTVTRWLQRPGPWKWAVVTNGIIMTLFLWHMTAYLVAILLLWPLGFGQQHDSTARWWLERPLWEIVPGLILLGIVLAVGRFERPKLVRRPAPAVEPAAETSTV